VAKPDVLARVQSDLAHGRTHQATQRLRTFLANEPDDLEIRRALAAIYRRTGNLAEAGRWSYLTDDVRPEEIAAFERANPSPWLQLRLLQFTADPAMLCEPARARLMNLAERAQRVGPPDIWSGPASLERPARRGNTVPCLFVVIALTVFAVLAVIGVYRAIVWIWEF
jgi:hypothetical protein